MASAMLPMMADYERDGEFTTPRRQPRAGRELVSILTVVLQAPEAAPGGMAEIYRALVLTQARLDQIVGIGVAGVAAEPGWVEMQDGARCRRIRCSGK